MRQKTPRPTLPPYFQKKGTGGAIDQKKKNAIDQSGIRTRARRPVPVV